MASMSEMLQYATSIRDQKVANKSYDPWANSAMDIIGGMQSGAKDFKIKKQQEFENQKTLLQMIQMGNKIQQQQQEIEMKKKQIEMMDMSRWFDLGNNPQKVGPDGQPVKKINSKDSKIMDMMDKYQTTMSFDSKGTAKIIHKEILPTKAKPAKILTQAEKEIQRNKIIEGYQKNKMNILKSGGAMYQGIIDDSAITPEMEEALLIEDNKIRKLNGQPPLTKAMVNSTPEAKKNWIDSLLGVLGLKRQAKKNNQSAKDSLGILGDE